MKPSFKVSKLGYSTDALYCIFTPTILPLKEEEEEEDIQFRRNTLAQLF